MWQRIQLDPHQDVCSVCSGTWSGLFILVSLVLKQSIMLHKDLWTD